jgi:hypothetical protein
MAKRRKRRSAIVPAMVLSASLASGVCVVPALVTGCNSSGVPTTSVAADGFKPSVAADFARPPVGLDVAAQDFAQPFSVAMIGFDLSGEG